MNVSVAMTAYNGEKYIYEQIVSIVSQLTEMDELVISDDGSTDRTNQIITELAGQYKQIHIISGPRQGVFKNFEFAIQNCTRDIVILSDQDDIWIDGKVEKIKEVFENNASINVVLHRAYKMQDSIKTNQMMVRYRKGFLQNLVKSCYWGCCMAMRRCYIQQYIPYHIKGIAHDQLVGLLAEKDKCTMYINAPLIYHRFHGYNQTQKRALTKKIVFRICLLKDYIICRHNKAGKYIN